MHCVDLDESFPTRIYLQKSASIQPRTSPFKFARSPRTDPPGSMSGAAVILVALLAELDRLKFQISLWKKCIFGKMRFSSFFIFEHAISEVKPSGILQDEIHNEPI